MRPLLLKMQAFGSYGKETTIDFTKPTHDLFLITGDTGAGKTTIFDAIIFALYGQASSSYNRKEGVLLQSQFAAYEQTPRVEFVFAASSAQDAPEYRIVRIPRHKRPKKRRGKVDQGIDRTELIEEKGSVELTLPDGTAYPEKNVDVKIEEIIGLTREQFMQVAMIAQGEFMEILRAKTDDKKEIFRKLFHTELYERIRCLLEARKKEKEKGIAVIRTQCQTEIEHMAIPEGYERSVELVEYRDEIRSGNLSRLSDLLDGLEALTGVLTEKKTGLLAAWEQAEKALTAAREAHTRAVSLADAFAEHERASVILAECEADRSAIEEKERRAARLAAAYEILPVYQRYADADQERTALEQKLAQQEGALPGLVDGWGRTCERLKEISARGEEQKRVLHAQLGRAADAIQLFDRKDRLEQEKKSMQEEYGSFCMKEQQAQQALEGVRVQQEACRSQIEADNGAIADKVRIEGEMKRVQALEERLNAFLELEKAVESGDKKLLKKQNELVAANKAYQEKAGSYEQLHALFLSEQAGILARELVEGEPCKVCGSKIHPAPYQLSGARAIPSQREVEDAQKERERSDKVREKKALEANELKTQVDRDRERCREERGKLCAELSAQDGDSLLEVFARYKESVAAAYKDCGERLLRLEKEKERSEKLSEQAGILEKELEATRDRLSGSKERLAGVEAALRELENNTGFGTREDAEAARVQAEGSLERSADALSRAEKENKQAGDRLENARSLIGEYQATLPQKSVLASERRASYEQAMAEKSFGSGQEWQQLTDQFSQETLLEWQEETAQYRKRVQGAKVRKETAASVIKDAEKPDMAFLEQEAARCGDSLGKIGKEKDACSRMLDDDERVLTALRSRMQQWERTFHEHMKLDGLYKIISGSVNRQNKMDLETFVQRHHLRQILVVANKRFEKMTAGQFELRLKDIDDAGKSRNEGLDLMVYSLVTGKAREIRTLSGGESFMAALSLALGMADQIKEHSGALHLDMMFIDEGFGSLDERSRGQAVRILKEMAGGGRLIGIISHVSELKQEIDDQLVVTRSVTGSRADWRSD